MPIHEYRCEDCGALLELFQQTSDPSPKLCGYRCALARDDDRDGLRGMGQLTRQISAHGGVLRSEMMGDRISMDRMRKAGFTVFTNEGDGTAKRAFGELGPEKVDRED